MRSFPFFRDLEHFFKEAFRILRKDGIFCFTVGNLRNKNNETIDIEEITDKKTGMKMYKHSQDYVLKLSQKFDFELLKKLEFIGLDHQKEDFYLKVS